MAKQFLDLTGLSNFKDLLINYVDVADAASIKGVGLSEDGKSILFYKEEPIEGATAAYSVELPQVDLSALMMLADAATAGNIAVFDATGQVIDSEAAISDFVKDITTGTTNGTISVDGTDVPVYGLGSAAYTDADDYDAAGEASAVLGTEEDAAGIATVYGALAAAKAAQETADGIESYDDTALAARISANEEAIETINGTGEGSIAYAVAQIVADAPEAYDTLVEIADWIASHTTDAATMNSNINANTSDIAELEALIGALPETATSTTVIDYIAEYVGSISSGVLSVTTGTTNGTISVDGTDVAVYGLGSAAYTDADAYEESGAAAAVLGTDEDAAGTATVYGALASANAAQAAVDEISAIASDDITALFA